MCPLSLLHCRPWRPSPARGCPCCDAREGSRWICSRHGCPSLPTHCPVYGIHNGWYNTVQSRIVGTPKSGKPPYNGQTLRIYCPYISTSEEGTTSKQWTKYSPPNMSIIRRFHCSYKNNEVFCEEDNTQFNL